jgi:hypothetical protein
MATIDDNRFAAPAFEEQVQVGDAIAVTPCQNIENPTFSLNDPHPFTVQLRQHGQRFGRCVIGKKTGDDRQFR